MSLGCLFGLVQKTILSPEWLQAGRLLMKAGHQFERCYLAVLMSGGHRYVGERSKQQYCVDGCICRDRPKVQTRQA